MRYGLYYYLEQLLLSELWAKNFVLSSCLPLLIYPYLEAQMQCRTAPWKNLRIETKRRKFGVIYKYLLEQNLRLENFVCQSMKDDIVSTFV